MCSKYQIKKMRNNQTPGTTTPGTAVTSSSVPTNVLTKKLQSELEILSKKVASLDQQVSFRVHVVSDLVEEVLSRWRSSTSLALHTISSLEQELARKTEALREAHARSADREATLASSDAEKEAIRVYATRLEEHLGRLVEASVAAVNTASADANAIPLQKPIIAALQQLMSETSNSKAVPHISASSASSSGDVDGLQSAVRSGDTKVSLFFANLDATYPPSLTSTKRNVTTRTSEKDESAPGTSERVARSIDVTLSRALDFAREKALADDIESTLRVSKNATSDNDYTKQVNTNSSSSSSSSSSAIIEIEFDPERHAEATVLHLIDALSSKSGRQVSRVKFEGKFLNNESAKLVDVGVPVKASIEVIFGVKQTMKQSITINSNINKDGEGSSTKTTHLPPPPPQMPVLHIPKTADPLPVLSKLLPPPKRQPLVSPTPHEAPKTLRDHTQHHMSTESETSTHITEGTLSSESARETAHQSNHDE
jgi:hypothetical protein